MEKPKLYIGSIEITIKKYVFTHSWIIQAVSTSVAEIFIDRYVEKLYGDCEYECEITAVYEIDKKDIALIGTFLPLMYAQK